MSNTINTVKYRNLTIEVKELTTGEYYAVVKRFDGYETAIVIQSDSSYSMDYAIDQAKSLLDEYLDDEFDY